MEVTTVTNEGNQTNSQPPAAPVVEPPAQQDDPPAMVSREEFERVQADMHKYKQQAREASAQSERLKLQGLKEKEDWKKVAEEYEAKFKESEGKYQGLQSALLKNEKMAAIRMEAQKAGIVGEKALEILELLEFPEVAVETTSTGRINVLGADRAIQRMKMERPFLFGKSVPSINPNSPGTTAAGTVSYEELMKSEEAARKSGDWSKHRELLQRFRSQQQR